MNAQSPSPPRRIWLCADDYGISAAVDIAIRDLVVRGRLNATSVLVAAPNFRGRLETAHFRHLDIGEDEISAHRVQQLERLAASACFADHRERQHFAAIVEQLAQPAPRGRLVVDDQDPQRGVSHAKPQIGRASCRERVLTDV